MASTVFQVVGRFRADTKQFSNSLAAASNSMKTFATSTERVAAKSQRTGAAMARFLSVPLLAVGGAAAAASIEFESAFVGVRKTVDATEEEFGRLEKAIRRMSTEIPVGASELARIGEIAGQLGIEARGLDKFIKVVADLGQTTTLNVEEGAFALARISNVMGIATTDADRLGATIVDLGNNFAATENEITTMAERIVGAAKVADASTPDVLALSTALSAVGLRAEAGGSSISRVFIQMQGAVREGGLELARYADVAGVSARQFADAFSNEPIEAVLLFIEGLERMRQAGGDVFSTLQDLQLSEIRVRDTLLRAAGAGDLVRRAVEIGNNAWEENTALVEEAEKRYASTESQLRMVWNQVVEAARAFGDVLAPVLLDVANTLGPMTVRFFELLGSFNDLSPTTRRVAMAIAGIAVAAGPLLFTVGKLMQMALGLRSIWVSLTTVGLNVAVAVESMAVAMGVKMTVALGALGIAIAGVVAAWAAYKSWTERVDEATVTAAESADALAQSTGMVKREIEEMGRVVDGSTDSVLDFRKANLDAIKTLQDLEGAARAQYLTEIGINLVASGAGSPEEVFSQLERLADAAGVNVPVGFTVDDIALENLVNTVGGVTDRIAAMLSDNSIAQNSGFLYDIFSQDVQQEVVSFGETLAQAMHSGEEGFEQALIAMSEFENELRNSDATSQQVSHTVNDLANTIIDLGQFSAISAGSVQNTGDLIRKLGEEGYITDLAMADLLNRTGNLTGEAQRFLSMAQRLPGTTTEVGDSMNDAAADAGAFADEMAAATQQVDEHIRALNALFDPFFAVMDSERKLKEAIAARRDALSQSADEMGGAEAQAAILAETEQALLEAIVENAAALERSKATLEQNSDAAGTADAVLRRMADAMGVSLEELEALTGGFGPLQQAILNTPNLVDINIQAGGFQHVMDQFGQLRRIIGEINGSTVDIRIGTGGPGSVQHSGGFAGTGPLRSMAHLKHDEVPAILQKGEFVLSRRMVGELNSIMKFHDGGYVVKKGDTLSGIAQSQMGDASAWRNLHEANKAKIENPHLIFPGQQLVIPHNHGTNESPASSGGSSSGVTSGFDGSGVFPGGISMGGITNLLSGSGSNLQQGVDKVRQMLDDMQRFQQEFDRAAQRSDLVSNITKLREELGAASGDEAKALADRLATAEQQLVSFDRQTARINAEFEIQKKLQEALARIEEQRAAAALRAEKDRNRRALEFEAMTTKQQIHELTRRMSAVDAYTDEWTDLYRQRARLMEEERQRAEELRKTFIDLADTIGRRWAAALRRMASSDEQFEQLADQASNFQSSWEGAITGFAGLVQNLGDKEFVRFESVVRQFEKKIQEAADFQGMLVELARRGLSDTIISQLAAAGPGAAPLASALLDGDVGVINSLQSQLESLTTAGAGEIFSSMIGTGPALPPKVDFTLIIDGEEIARVVGQHLAEEITVRTGVS